MDSAPFCAGDGRLPARAFARRRCRGEADAAGSGISVPRLDKPAAARRLTEETRSPYSRGKTVRTGGPPVRWQPTRLPFPRRLSGARATARHAHRRKFSHSVAEIRRPQDGSTTKTRELLPFHRNLEERSAPTRR